MSQPYIESATALSDTYIHMFVIYTLTFAKLAFFQQHSEQIAVKQEYKKALKT